MEDELLAGLGVIFSMMDCADTSVGKVLSAMVGVADVSEVL